MVRNNVADSFMIKEGLFQVCQPINTPAFNFVL